MEYWVAHHAGYDTNVDNGTRNAPCQTEPLFMSTASVDTILWVARIHVWAHYAHGGFPGVQHVHASMAAFTCDAQSPGTFSM